ncbi:MAG: DUF2225 domain-containing protein [Treponema sp.]|nr:DUF2225 domain-containing protein [Treponema sp.]HAK68409.1 DUF2225 domain-containing protein [Treponema sp.]HBB42120.1 DUF2225 domain-containing protein [Treponema sp.]
MSVSSNKNGAEGRKPSITYWAKDKIVCPVCKKPFAQEVMQKGGGRMIAGPLTDELHRVFEPSKKYGRIFPMIYEVGCCPNCHTAFYWKDFTDIRDEDTFTRLFDDRDRREAAVETLFPYHSLTENRSLYDGAAMYYSALLCYEKVDIAYAPTFKRGQICLRLAWMCRDLDLLCPGHNFEYVAQVFYRKALFFYQQTLINETGRIESIEPVSNFGPDVDKNYGYDGVIYISGLLEYKYGQKQNKELRLKKLEEFKKSIARIFGLGKSSKEKPGPLLELAKNLYDKIGKELSSNNILIDD